MAWDSKRPVPWKRMGVLLALYASLMLGVTAFSNKGKIGTAALSVLFGVVVAGAFLVIMTKFGWTMPILRSREELAAARTERMEAKARSRRGGVESVAGPRPKPAPTKRTSTGPSQRPTRKR